jgi:hypothetical protein
MRIVRRNIRDHLTHCMTAQTLFTLGAQAAGERIRGNGWRGRIEVMTRRTMNGEGTHPAQRDPCTLMATGLPACPVARREFMQGRRMTFHAFQTLQHGVGRLQVDAVTHRLRDQQPFVRITANVAILADLVRNLSVLGQTIGILEDLRHGHAAALRERRLVACLAAQVAMSAASETLVRILHEVARHAEIVVVLDVVVAPVRENATGRKSCDEHRSHSDKNQRRQRTQALTDAHIRSTEPLPARRVPAHRQR